MRILLTSDTHLGITTKKSIKKMLDAIDPRSFDVLVHAGDFSGTTYGAKAVRDTVKLVREFFPTKPFITVLGNHDYWCVTGKPGSKPSLSSFTENLDQIMETFKEHNVHFLDTDGVWSHDSFPMIHILGVSGWYKNMNPPTNDKKYMPYGLEGNTDGHLLMKAEKILMTQVDSMKEKTYEKIVFVSHFPVVKVETDREFDLFSWDHRISEFIEDELGEAIFLNGHSHQNNNGPKRFECGSDYMSPKYKIIEI
jgi:Icc-related predicted phosphoesterase